MKLNNNTTTSEDGHEAMMREIERKIEEAGETPTDEILTDTDEEEDKSEAGPEPADETLTNMIDQMINSLQRSEASDELIDLAKELCRVIN
jgi:hypothetical protein